MCLAQGRACGDRTQNLSIRSPTMTFYIFLYVITTINICKTILQYCIDREESVMMELNACL